MDASGSNTGDSTFRCGSGPIGGCNYCDGEAKAERDIEIRWSMRFLLVRVRLKHWIEDENLRAVADHVSQIGDAM